MRTSAGAKRILIVEDEAAVGHMLAEALSDEGHRVIGPIESRTEALTVVEQARPDVAILDIMLRDGSCGPVISELRDRGIPFMIFSGRGRHGQARRCSMGQEAGPVARNRSGPQRPDADISSA